MSAAGGGPERPRGQLPLGVELRAGCRLDNFVPRSGETVRETLSALLDGTAHGRIYLQGAPASGKSHLLEAVCHAGAARGQRVAYVPLERRARWSCELLAGLETLDLVCLDDLHAIAGDRDWERAVFNLFNAVDARGARLLVASRRPPSVVELPDLASRLGSMLRIALEPPDDAHRCRILKSRAREFGFELGDDAVRYLLERWARDLHSLVRVLEGVDRFALAAKRRVTRALVREYLSQLDAQPGGGSAGR